MKWRSPDRTLHFTIILMVLGLVLSDPFLVGLNSRFTQTLFVLPFLVYSFCTFSVSRRSQFLNLVLIYDLIVIFFFSIYGFNNVELLSNLFGTSLLGIAIYNNNVRNYIVTYGLRYLIISTTIFCFYYYFGSWEMQIAGRSTFISHNENFLGQLLCTSFTILLYKLSIESKRKMTLLWLCLILLHVIPTMATISRTAITLLILTTFIFIFFQLKLYGRIFFIFLFLFISLNSFYFVKFISNENEFLFRYLERTLEAKDDERAELWEIGINLAKGNLFTGVGFDKFYDYTWRGSVGLLYEINDSATGTFKSEIKSIHNSFIDLLLIGGIWLFFSFISIILIAFKNAASLLYFHSNKMDKKLGCLMMALLLNVLLFSITGQGATQKFTWFVFGLIFIFYEGRTKLFSTKNTL
jgi:O-antigen ligase